MADNMSDLRKLRGRVEEIAKDMNLELMNFSITPAKDADGNDILNIAAFIKVEALETIEETEQRGIDDQFNAIFAAEFGTAEDFVDDDTRKIIERDKAQKDKAQAELQAMLDEMEGK